MGYMYVIVLGLLTACVVYSTALGTYSSHACSSNDIQMNCPQPGDPTGATYILIDNSTYGVYSNSNCEISCCDPDPQMDCQVPVNSGWPDDYDDIITKCNMSASSCSHMSLVNNDISAQCGSPGISQFHVIYYTCVFSDGNPPTTTTTTTTTTTSAPPSTESESPLPTRPLTTKSSGGEGGTNIGAIIGGVLGGICAIAIIIMIVLLCIRRKEFMQARKSHGPRPVNIRNGGAPKGAVIVYDNHAYDEEMMMNNGKTVKAVSSRPNSVHYENVNNSTTSQNDTPDGLDTISQTTGTTYENVEVQPSKKVQNSSPKKENNNVKDEKKGPVPTVRSTPKQVTPTKAEGQFEKKNTPSSNEKAPVAKKAQPATNLSKAASAIDVSTTQKLDKQAAHKQSAPCLGTELSTPVDVEALKKEKTSNKDKIKEESEDEELGPGKELF